MTECGGGGSPSPLGVPPPPAPSPRPPILSRRPVCSVMLTLLLFSLSFREKKRRRIEELLAEKLVLPGGRGPLRGPPPPLPRPRGPAAAGPGGWEGAPGAQAPRSRSPPGPGRCLAAGLGTAWRPSPRAPGQRRDLGKGSDLHTKRVLAARTHGDSLNCRLWELSMGSD